MTKFESIRRDLLQVTQDDLAKALGMSQANVSNYETGRQTLPPKVARQLIDYAKSKGVDLTYDNIYADECSISPTDGAVQPLTR